MNLAQNTLESQMLAAVEEDLRRTVQALPAQGGDQLRAMIVHHFGWTGGTATGGGKRVRPLLTLLACHAAGGDWRDALPAATSAECIHNFSLIHDDIQDRSDTRRGRSTVWKEWGDAQAINAGDALFALARLASVRLLEHGLSAEVVLAVQREFDQACLELTRGQYLDLAYEELDSVTAEDYLEMVRAKTASLLASCASAGARIAGANASMIGLFRDFAMQLGIAFQIHDDILGIWGDPSVTGKAVSDDLASRKKTFPVLHGLETSAGFLKLWSNGATDEQSLIRMARELEDSGALAATQQASAEHTHLALDQLGQLSEMGAETSALSDLAQTLLRRRQ